MLFPTFRSFLHNSRLNVAFGRSMQGHSLVIPLPVTCDSFLVSQCALIGALSLPCLLPLCSAILSSVVRHIDVSGGLL